MIINASGNVGIGTTSPSTLLHIAQTQDNKGIKISSGTVQPEIEFTDTATGDSFSIGHNRSASQLAIEVDGTDKYVFTDGGRFGINTTSPSSTLSVISDQNSVARFVTSVDRAVIQITDEDTTAYIGVKDNEIGIGSNATPTADANFKIDVTTNTVGFGLGANATDKFRIRHSVNTSSDTSAHLMLMDLNISGTDALTGDRTISANRIDIDSSATGGNQTEELHIYGNYVTIDDTGDANHLVGSYSIAKSRKTVANDTQSTVHGVRGTGTAQHTAGHVNSVYGGQFIAQSDNDGGTLSNMYGIHASVTNTSDSSKDVNYAAAGLFKVDIANSSNDPVFTSVYGVDAEIETDENTTINNAFAHFSRIDANAGTITGGYLYRGIYSVSSGATVTNKHGISLIGSDRNYIEGSMNLGGTSSYNQGVPLAVQAVATNTAEVLTKIWDGGTFAFSIDRSSTNTDANTELYRLGLNYNNNGAQNGYIGFFRGSDGTNGYLTFGSSNTERMRITSAGNVGIGTTSPNTKLHIVSTSADADALIVQDNARKLEIGRDQIQVKNLSGDATLMYLQPNSNLAINTNGGNTGIGTTSPSYKLSVNGDIQTDFIRGYTYPNNSFLDFDDDQTVHANVTRLASIGRIVYMADTNNNEPTTNPAHQFFTSTSDADTATSLMQIRTDGKIVLNSYGSGTFTGTATQRLAVDSSGNIIEVPIGSGAVDGSGAANKLAIWSDADTLTSDTNLHWDTTNDRLGINTDSPSVQLEVHGSDGVKVTQNSGALTAGYFAQMKSDYGSNALRLISRAGDVFRATNFGQAVSILTGTTSSGTSERIRITDAGLVGIGTTSPTIKLDVNSAGSDSVGRFQSTDLRARILIQDSADISYFGTYNGTTFLGSDDTVSTNNLQITSSGRVGIGTTSPAEKLHVSGEVLFSGTGVRTTKTVGTDSSLEVQNGISIFRTTNTVGWLLDSNASNHLGLYNWNRNGYVLKIEDNTPTGTIYVKSNGNIGIGTTSPTEKLHIEITDDTFNDINILNLKRVWSTASGSDRSHGIKFSDFNSTNALIYADRTNSASNYSSDLIFYTNTGASGTNLEAKMIIKNTGNIGIGTTSPGEKLEISGTGELSAKINNTQYSRSFTITQGGGYSHLKTSHPSGVAINYGQGNVGILSLFNNTTQVIKINANGDSYFNGGNVGIGTTSPTAKLHLQDGDFRITGIFPRIYLQDSNHDSDFSIINGNGNLRFYDDTNTADRLYISADGNIGIGTTSPINKLDVNGIIAVNQTAGGNSGIKIITRNDAEAFLVMGDPDDNSMGGIAYNNNTNSLSIDCNNAERITINSSGNVGIGTTSPDHTLHAYNPTINVVGQFESGDNRAWISVRDDGYTTYGALFGCDHDAGKAIILADNSVNHRLVINNSGAVQFNAYGSGTFTGTATQRLAVDSSGNIIEVPIGSGAVDGSGTANTVTMWSDADTLTNAPITISSNDATFAGNVSADNITSTSNSGDASIYINSTRPTLGFTDTNSFTDPNDIYIVRGTGGNKLTFQWYDDSASSITETFNITNTGNAISGNITFGDSHFIGDDSFDNLHILPSSGENLVLQAPTNNYIDLKTQGGSTMVIKDNKVGIGTTSPSHLLSIGTSGNASGKKLTFYLGSSDGNYAGIGAQRGETNLYCSSEIRFINESNSSGSGAMSFNTGLNSLNERMRIDSSGNVGIGTTNPSTKLHVRNGEATIASDTDGVKLSYSNGNSSGIIDTAFSDNNLEFRTNGTAKMWIANAGLVGIGTISPTSVFEVYGGSTGTNDIDRYVRFKASNGEKRFDFYIGGTGNASVLNMYSSDGTTKGVQIASGGTTYFNGGNIGIGTTSPTGKLNIVQSSTTDPALRLTDDGVASYDFTFPDTSTIQLGTNTTSDKTFKLVNAGSGNFNISVDNATLKSTAPELLFSETGSSTSNRIYADGGNLHIDIDNTANDSGNLKLLHQGTQFAVFKGSTGALGIGTTLPVNPLHVEGNFTLRGNQYMGDDEKLILGLGSDLQIYHDGSNSYIDETGTGYLFIRASAAIDLTNLSGSENIARFIENDRVELYFNGNKKFETTSTGTTTSGVGYFTGGTSPDFGAGAVNNAGVIIQEGDYIYTKDGTSVRKLIGKASDIIEIGQSGTSLIDEIRLKPGNNGFTSFYDDSSETARFTDGKLGLGITSPSVKLDVTDSDTGAGYNDGVARFINTTTATSGGSAVINVRNTYGAGFGGLLKFWSTSTSSSIGNISFNSGVTAVNYNTTSDYRLKEDYRDFNGLNIISDINVYDFKWRNVEDRSYGVIAHELNDVVPSAVTGVKDGEDMQGVDYSKLVPLLIKSVQELKAENVALQARISALENN